LCLLNKRLGHSETKDFVVFWEVLGIIESGKINISERASSFVLYYFVLKVISVLERYVYISTQLYW
jgi:hypothetical protein